MGTTVSRFRIATLYVALVALVATTLVMITAREARSFPGANGLIAYEVGGGIGTIQPDGTGAEVLAGQAIDAAWSADGQHVAFADTSSSTFLIYTIDADGTNRTQVTTTGNDFEPAFSPDGDWITFRRRVVYPNAINDTTNNLAASATEITESDSVPTSGLIGMIAENITTGNTAIVTAVTGSSAPYTITTTAITGDWNPADGYRIYNEQDRIFKIMTDGTGETQLSCGDSTDVYSDYAPDWSPDGSQIAFATKRNGNDDVYVMPAAGEGVGCADSTNLTGDELNVAWDPAFSPDGTEIAFASANDGTGMDSAQNIWTMNADGTGKEILTTEATSKDEHPSWSPDGTLIAFEREVTTPGAASVWTVPAAGGTATQIAGSGSAAAEPHWQPTLGGVDDAYGVDEGATLTIAAGSGVLSNDQSLATDVGTTTATKLTDPANGTLTLNADGSFTYVHDDSDTTSDTFTYRPVQGGVDGSTATVTITITPVDDAPHLSGLVDVSEGLWFLLDGVGDVVSSFYFGNPGDVPFVGDWNGDGVETPGLYRQSDGFVYLRNSNTAGVADVQFFFGNPGDVPIAGDFDGDGFDTVSIYRPSNQTFYIINELGSNNGGLGAAEFEYVFGDPGDNPFVGDFDGDGVETVGLHRESTGLVYFRNSHTQGNADAQFIFGDPGDRVIAGDWTGDGVFSPALYRPSDTTMYFRYTNTQGNADLQFTPDGAQTHWVPIAGNR